MSLNVHGSGKERYNVVILIYDLGRFRAIDYLAKHTVMHIF